jgi:hypothetical protein
MGTRRWGAFKGYHEMPDDTRIAVAYLGLAECRRYVNPDKKPMMADWRRCGWYWFVSPRGAAMSVATTFHGPFTSSLQAYNAATTRHKKAT